MKYPKQISDLAWRRLGDTTVIIDMMGQRRFHELNEVGSMIWHFCDGSHSVDQIIETIGEEFEVEPPQARTDVLEFLAMLERESLITITPERCTGP